MSNAQILKATTETIRMFLVKLNSVTGREYSPAEKASVNRMLQAVLANQTQDEVNAGDTKHKNGEGFTGADAYILTAIGTKAQRWALSEKQARLVAKRLVKYSRQIAQAKLAGGGVPAPSQAQGASVASNPAPVSQSTAQNATEPENVAPMTQAQLIEAEARRMRLFRPIQRKGKGSKLWSAERNAAFNAQQDARFDKALAELGAQLELRKMAAGFH